MLIGFLGAPCSGKTTVAAKMFAELKDSGLPTEFVCERARLYIAKARIWAEQRQQAFTLSDTDQLAIARSQFADEVAMNQNGIIVVSDSSALNSLLYMSPEFRQTPEVHALMQAAAAQYDYLFVCGPVPRPICLDPNRVHDEAQSLELHNSLPEITKAYVEQSKIQTLVGPAHVRLHQALSLTLDRYTKLV
jgi:nicotinamide riboside kinase